MTGLAGDRCPEISRGANEMCSVNLDDTMKCVVANLYENSVNLDDTKNCAGASSDDCKALRRGSTPKNKDFQLFADKIAASCDLASCKTDT